MRFSGRRGGPPTPARQHRKPGAINRGGPTRHHRRQAHYRIPDGIHRARPRAPWRPADRQGDLSASRSGQRRSRPSSQAASRAGGLARNADMDGQGEDAEMPSKPHAARLPGRGWLKNGNPPGNPDNAPRCGAKTRAGHALPSAVDAERPMPDARWPLDGPAHCRGQGTHPQIPLEAWPLQPRDNRTPPHGAGNAGRNARATEGDQTMTKRSAFSYLRPTK